MTSHEWQTWLESQNLTVLNGKITSTDANNPTSGEETTTLTLLGHERLLTFSGAENRKFLQGQLTCDVVKLTDKQTVHGACCTPKGRMVANFRMVAIGEDLTTVLPVDQIEYLNAHLSKYAAFFRTVSITDTSDNWVRMGLSGPKAASLVAKLTGQDAPPAHNVSGWQHGLVVPVSPHSPRFEIWVQPDAAQSIWQTLSAEASITTTQHWQLQDIQEGIAWVTEATRENWIPQHLNWQAIGGVSFTKGCYTGQEIVARMKYLGKLKSHLYRFTAENDTAPPVGAVVNNNNAAKTGDVVAALPSSQNTVDILAVVRKDDAEAGGLTLAESNIPLTLQPLSYSLSE